MSMDPNNPYASSSPNKPMGSTASLDFAKALQAPFEGEGAIVTLILCGLCAMFGMFIFPLMVLYGYGFETAEAKIVTGGAANPKFNMDRIGAYVNRGVWPWLIAFIAGSVVGCVFYIAVLAVVLVASAVLGDNAGIAGLFILPLYLALIAGMYGVVSAATLQAGLTQSSSNTFDFGWIFDFCGKMWKELLLSVLVLMVVSFVAEIAGVIALCVGLIPAIGYITMVQFNIQAQLYPIYLSRGGRPLPFKQDPSTMPVYGPGPGTPGSNPFT